MIGRFGVGGEATRGGSGGASRIFVIGNGGGGNVGGGAIEDSFFFSITVRGVLAVSDVPESDSSTSCFSAGNGCGTDSHGGRRSSMHCGCRQLTYSKNCFKFSIVKSQYFRWSDR